MEIIFYRIDTSIKKMTSEQIGIAEPNILANTIFVRQIFVRGVVRRTLAEWGLTVRKW